MRTSNTFKSIISVSLLLLIISCAKTPTNQTSPTPPAPPIIPVPPIISNDSFTVDNKWECEIDGISYHGSVDTSFINITSPGTQTADTVIDCNGTAAGTLANIHFQFRINRTSKPGPIKTSYGDAMLVFDTITPHFLIASNNYYTSGVIYNIDTLKNNKLKARFNGVVTQYDVIAGSSDHNITNGKFNCEFGKGNMKPNNFSFSDNGVSTSGYFNSAKITSNCLILEGQPYTFGGSQIFTLLVRTGGTVKPGIYNSNDGDAGFRFYSPSIYTYYITDTLGDLQVVIDNIQGDIVKGSYSGTREDGRVAAGTFACKIKNYIPQADYLNKWKFSEDESTFLYNIYGGNVLNASLFQLSKKYFLTVNGESDNGDSQFKIVLSSDLPITTSVYETKLNSNHLDSLYFKSNTRIWNGNTTSLFSDDYYSTYCKIDTIDNYHVTGTLYGKIRIILSPNFITSADIKKGSFRVSF